MASCAKRHRPVAIVNTDEYKQSVNDIIDASLIHAKRVFHRQVIVVSGQRDWCHETTSLIARHHINEDILFISSRIPGLSNVVSALPKDALRFLGHEFAHAVIDFHDGFDPNILGAISGCVSGGGLLLLLMPPLKDLPQFDDPETQRMAVWPYSPRDVNHRFLQRLTRIISNADDIVRIEQLPELTVYAPSQISHIEEQDYLENHICRTLDQEAAVEAIEHVATGHRRRPLVITADRGRGKSAALGIASALLLKANTSTVIVTAPRRRATDKVFKHARHLLGATEQSTGNIHWNGKTLSFIAPDELCRQLPDGQLLLIDEAAAIPAPMLEKLLNHYPRVVFATTTYGYEGTGRGFSVKFQQTLRQKTPGWRLLEMQTPVRWAPHDPAEAFVFYALCLDSTVEPVARPQTNNVNVIKLDRDQLIYDEQLLSSIFGLLVLAHYQTQPRDLRYLLDAIGLDIYIARQNDRLIGTALIEHEGELDATTANMVFRNERRVTGHLLAQTMEAFAGIKNASQNRYVRLMRIAVHPDYRRNGVATQLLQRIENDARHQQVDIIGSNFGASEELLAFWHQADYITVQVGLTKNASTGHNSVTCIKSLSSKGDTISHLAINKFMHEFPLQLAEPYRDLACEIVAIIFRAFTIKNNLALSQEEWRDIDSFANALRGYEINRVAIVKLVIHVLGHEALKRATDDYDTCLLIKKVLQQRTWRHIVESFELPGKQCAIDRLRGVVKRLIGHHDVLKTIKITQD
jgi:tRNA(Met) cytidine acetyltransferase